MLRAGAAQSTSTAKIGPSRDPADIEHSVGIKRDPDLHRPQLHELSITHFTLAADGPDDDLADLDAWIKWHDRTNAWHASAPAAVSYWPALTDSGRLRASLNRRVMAALICMFFTAMPSGWVTTVSTRTTPVRVYQYFEIPEMSVAIR